MPSWCNDIYDEAMAVIVTTPPALSVHRKTAAFSLRGVVSLLLVSSRKIIRTALHLYNVG